MQEKLKPLEMDERRVLVAAAKDVTDFRVSAVTSDFGIAPNNLYSFLNGRGNSIGAATQVLVMKNYGFTACGTLMDYLHSWVVADEDSFVNIKSCLAHEVNISDVQFVKVFTNLDYLEFIGAYFQFKSSSSAKPRRIIVTMNSAVMKPDAFLQGLFDAFGISAAHCTRDDDMCVSNSAAREVWRWKYGRSHVRRTPFRTPPKLRHLDYEFPLSSGDGVIESPTSLLSQILPRFERLSEENAKLKGNSKLSSWDVSLISRAKKTLENM